MNNNIEISESESLISNKNNKENTFNIIKEGWDKLSSEYETIVKNVKSFNESLDEAQKKFQINNIIIREI